ncbi:MAG: hypothetical protein WA621_06605 [Candidatus Acidiferrum sp.]
MKRTFRLILLAAAPALFVPAQSMLLQAQPTPAATAGNSQSHSSSPDSSYHRHRRKHRKHRRHHHHVAPAHH